MDLSEVLRHYDLPTDAVIAPLGAGLIHHTWKVTAGDRSFVLQKINTSVFKYPLEIQENIDCVSNYLRQHAPGYLFISSIRASDGETLLHLGDDGYFRLTPFVEGSHTIQIVDNAQQAYEAARQFALLTYTLRDLDNSRLFITIENFHDLDKRYNNFTLTLLQASDERKLKAKDAIIAVQGYLNILETYRKIRNNTEFKLRVTHHDAKINNVLFDKDGKGLCVIDLDTLMPGHFISDVGDMMRTYLSPVTEDDEDVSKIIVRQEIYQAIVDGYTSVMKDELTGMEKEYFFYAGQFMMYMQAIRFLTDYLQNDIYYKPAYEEQNLVRAKNQLELLKRFNSLTV